MIVSPATHEGSLALRADVAVVGSGPGGAAAAAVLAGSGAKVVVLEAGKRFLPHQLVPRLGWAHENLYAAHASRVARGEVFIPVRTAEVVGGGSLVNSAICFRAPEAVLDGWARDHGLDAFGPAEMKRFFDRVEADLRIAKTPPGVARGNALLFKAGAERLGLSGDFISRNAPDCIGCGSCNLGCPVGGKASVDRNWLHTATKAGATIVTEARASKVLVEGGRAVGIAGEFGSKSFEVRASTVVLAGGAFGTPTLLMRSGLGHPDHVGRHLHLHPSCGTFGFFDFDVRLWDGATQGYYVDDLAKGLLLETFSATPEVFFAGLPRKAFDPLQLRRMGAAGCMVRDEGEGSFTPDGDDVSLAYDLADADRKRLLEGLRRIVRVFFAAGARRVFPGLAGAPLADSEAGALALLHDDVSPKSIAIQSVHPHGSARMTGSAETGVVDPTGRVRGVERLFVTDASLFPTALGVNPMVTIGAFSLRIAEGIAHA